MKTFRMIGAVLVAVLMCVNFASCSKDDDEDLSSGDIIVNIPTNTIRYQTVNGVIVNFENENVFGGLEIVSNTYSDGYGTIEFVSDVTKIGARAFYDNETLLSITLPSSVASIGDKAFQRCESLKSVTLSNGLVSIGDDAFLYCSSLESIKIPSSVKRVGRRVFDYCSNLEKAELDCESIGSYFFNVGVGNLKEIILGNNVKVIGSSAFSGCDGLTSVTIGNSVTSIGDYAFSSCSNLKTVTIGNSVTSIGDGAFHWCTGLTSVYVKWSTPVECDYFFDYDIFENATLYVPRGSLSAYKATEPWSEFENIQEY